MRIIKGWYFFGSKMERNHMSQYKKTLKPLSLAIGATFVATMATSTFASAATAGNNPFAMNDLHSGYSQVAEMAKDGKCGEGKCSSDKQAKKAKDAKCGADKAKAEEEAKKAKEAKCGGNK
jgi:uncharacterized low-complexity protein